MALSKVRVDIISDTVCPWCFVGKRRMEEAMKQFKGQKQFEVHWHPFFLNPDASKEGFNKLDYYKEKFGADRIEEMVPLMAANFKQYGLDYSLGGKTGNTLNSHRLIHWAGEHGLDKQDAVVENLFKAYFAEEKFLNDPAVLVAAAEAAGLPDAAQFVANEEEGKAEVMKDYMEYAAAEHVTGVPYFIVNGKYRLSGAQDPQRFADIFAKA